MSLLISAWTIGLIFALLALGVYISFRVFEFPDITVDGSFTLGAAVAARMAVDGHHPLVGAAVAVAAGAVAGATTGVLHTKFKINGLLAGILVMTALYSINLRVMGRSTITLADDASKPTLAYLATHTAESLRGSADPVTVAGWQVPLSDLAHLAAAALLAGLIALVLYLFFRTHLGTAMRATGSNAQMVRAMGISVDRMTISGLALANALVALAGACYAPILGSADAQMGIGMVVRGLACVILGAALVGGGTVGWSLLGTVVGSILFSLLIALALQGDVQPTDLRLVIAVFVLVALVAPAWVGQLLRKMGVKHG